MTLEPEVKQWSPGPQPPDCDSVSQAGQSRELS